MKKNTPLYEKIEQTIKTIRYPESAQELYAPIRYTLSMGGKRIRPVLTLMATEMFGGDIDMAIYPAIGLETFHNFTLLHDDLMDHADVRRNQPTVHIKWGANAAILSGDAMQIIASDLVCMAPSKHLREALQLFNKTALEICEGQQYDMEFEQREDVTKKEYLEMIRLKTAVLLGCALKMGALLADASPEDANLLYTFGEKIGLAFQLKDDLLDVYADQSKFGKKIGGDILNNKKTYLLLNALEKADAKQKEAAWSWMNKTTYEAQEKIDHFVQLYKETQTKEDCETLMLAFYNEGIAALRAVSVAEEQKEPLYTLANELMYREL